ncbi:glycosyltransferase family 4 protein [Nocardioides massiliensis]|uniref:Glycosyltransferase involved in cell wall biosynthesis n=1 Tax=Nocardioides massiliensis TaxID=1325935 RepID=A0ABT9NMJ2_9ACTN|nr:glycosyltransferase family 4 protein [Nocardioides massiliensis]MDP9821637.1 glycosyltransferase involved in cell wall biosynthesis [Nocardioides massiliensis]
MTTVPASERGAGRGAAGGRRLPRVVMLVDNDVRRDSRVQKQAASMAARGWDVVLLGRGKPGREQRWRIGDARVRLVPVPTAMRFRYGDLRRARLRSPLSYPLYVVSERRQQEARARREDVRQRIVERQFPRDGAPRPTWPLIPARGWAKLRYSWTDLRARRTEVLRTRRAGQDTAADRVSAWWWQRLLGERAWQRLDPHLWDFHLSYAEVIDQLDPDLVHANDFRMLGVGARAVTRARERGRTVPLVWDAHEFLPGLKPWTPGAKWHRAQMAHERQHAPYADAVVTVSEELADLLIAEHGLAERPTIVLNAPVVEPADDAQAPPPSLREACGVEPTTPLMVYSGAAAPQRGLDLMVEVLPLVPEVHCCFVVSANDGDYVRSLVERAAALGVADRLHLAPYVPFDQVVDYLAGADLGVIPIEHWPNHEIALITKFFEYSHARLPIVVSDVRAMAEMTRRTGQGEVFTAGSVEDLASAVRKVLADPAPYRAAYDAPGLLAGWTWEAQADVLDGVYRRVLGLPGAPRA